MKFPWLQLLCKSDLIFRYTKSKSKCYEKAPYTLTVLKTKEVVLNILQVKYLPQPTQPACTCSELTIKAPKQFVEFAQS